MRLAALALVVVFVFVAEGALTAREVPVFAQDLSFHLIVRDDPDDCSGSHSVSRWAHSTEAQMRSLECLEAPSEEECPWFYSGWTGWNWPENKFLRVWDDGFCRKWDLQDSALARFGYYYPFWMPDNATFVDADPCPADTIFAGEPCQHWLAASGPDYEGVQYIINWWVATESTKYSHTGGAVPVRGVIGFPEWDLERAVCFDFAPERPEVPADPSAFSPPVDEETCQIMAPASVPSREGTRANLRAAARNLTPPRV